MNNTRNPSRPFGIEQVVAEGLCVGCGACAVASDGAVRMHWNRHQLYEADLGRLAGKPEAAERASAACPFSDDSADEDEIARTLWPDTQMQHSAQIGFHAAVGVGRIKDNERIARHSSGGLTSYVLRALLGRGEVDGVIHVRSCQRDDGVLMEYRVSRHIDEVDNGAKSRYYPVEMSAALTEIRGDGHRYALVGVPCFIKAARLLCQQDEVLRAQLPVMLGLVCGHLKSGAFAANFAWQLGVMPPDLVAFDFRVKDPTRPANHYAVAAQGAGGRPPVVAQARGLFGADWGLTMFRPRACDYCDDIAAEVADACFGDAWLRKYDADWRGTNIFVIRLPLIQTLLSEGAQRGELELFDSNADEFVSSQLANYRHRREGLLVRLAERARRGQASPARRCHPPAPTPGFLRRQTYLARAEVGERSHDAFLAARQRGDYAQFEAGLQGLVERYLRLRWLAERLTMRNVARKLLRMLRIVR